MTSTSNSAISELAISIKPLYLSTTFTFLLISFISFAQPAGAADVDRNLLWLPKKYQEELYLVLYDIASHANNRSRCMEVLEAKLSDNSPEENHKFIVTCRKSDNSTINYVYHQSDVLDGFSEHLSDDQILQNQSLLSEQEKQKDPQYQLKQLARSNCIDRLIAQLGEERKITLDESKGLKIRARRNGTVVVIIDYILEDNGIYPPRYTGVCLHRGPEDIVVNITRR